jgi:hypothetical protein
MLPRPILPQPRLALLRTVAVAVTEATAAGLGKAPGRLRRRGGDAGEGMDDAPSDAAESEPRLVRPAPSTTLLLRLVEAPRIMEPLDAA